MRYFCILSVAGVLAACGERQELMLTKLGEFHPHVTTCQDVTNAFGFAPTSVKRLADGRTAQTWVQTNPYDISQRADVTIKFDKDCVMLGIMSEGLTASGTQI
ncbi:MAG: hypothetical protein M0006_17085 [Magnetospirillum sp.]|nr:hypothetical protein [Magnetospirillum sp.]